MTWETCFRTLRPESKRDLLCVPDDSWTVRVRTRQIYTLGRLYAGGRELFLAFMGGFRRPEEFGLYADFLWGERLSSPEGDADVERFVTGFRMRWLSDDRFFLVIDNLFISDRPFEIPLAGLSKDRMLRATRKSGDGGLPLALAKTRVREPSGEDADPFPPPPIFSKEIPWYEDPDLGLDDLCGTGAFTRSMRSGKKTRPHAQGAHPDRDEDRPTDE